MRSCFAKMEDELLRRIKTNCTTVRATKHRWGDRLNEHDHARLTQMCYDIEFILSGFSFDAPDETP